MKRDAISPVMVALLFSLPAAAAEDLTDAPAIAYCQLIQNPRAFDGKLVRVRALYETDFEKMALTAPSCASPLPMTWVDFENGWESRTSWRLRRAMTAAGSKWNVQTDVVLVGKFRSSGASFGHNGMYPFLLQVYKVEALKPFGNFRPLPDTKRAGNSRKGGVLRAPKRALLSDSRWKTAFSEKWIQAGTGKGLVQKPAYRELRGLQARNPILCSHL
jgi:hypothetical protein